MRFKRIKIKNIRSYKEQEIEFPEGSLLLSGDVGSGKTSVLLAIEYALFGLQPGQKGNSLLRNNALSGEVEFEFELPGKQVVIERKLKKTTKGVSNDYAAIIINGEKTESSVTEIKSMIISELGYPPEFVKKNNLLYRYTVYTPQEEMKQIILEDPETRLNVLRHIFGVDRYRQIKNNLSILITSLKSETRMLQGEASMIESDKENLKLAREKYLLITSNIKRLSQTFAALYSKRIEKEREIENLKKILEEKRTFEREVEKSGMIIAAKKESIFSIINEAEELNKNLNQENINFSEKDYSDLAQNINFVKERVESLYTDKLNIHSRFNSLEKEKKEILEKKERIFRIEICPTCLQDVSEVHKHNIMNETESKLSKIKSEISSLNLIVEEISGKLAKEKNYLEEMQSKRTALEILKSKVGMLEKSRERVLQLLKRRSLLEEDLKMLESHLNSLKEKVFFYSSVESQFNVKDTELKKAFEEEKNAEIALAEERKELELSGKEISIFEGIVKRKNDALKKLKNISEFIDWLLNQFLKLVETIEASVLQRLRREFSILFRKWFLMLVTENAFDTQIDENFTPIIMQGDSEMSYGFLSGGERTAVALAYRLALNQTINSLMSKIKTRNIIILDEPTDGFSETQIGRIRDILEELNTEQLIIVSHEQKIESFVDNVLRISKPGTASMIEQHTYQKT